jgi:hypothetical protein
MVEELKHTCIHHEEPTGEYHLLLSEGFVILSGPQNREKKI